jgi:hypothetical protein
MTTLIYRSLVYKSLKIILGLILLTSAISKAFNPGTAAALIAQILGHEGPGSLWLVYVLCVAESVIAVLLFSERTVKAASLLSSGFFLISLVLGIGFLDKNTECGCFGNLFSSQVDGTYVLRNLAFLGIALGILRLSTPIVPNRKG